MSGTLTELRAIHADMIEHARQVFALAERFGRTLEEAERKAAAKAVPAPTQIEYDRTRLDTPPAPVQPAPAPRPQPTEANGDYQTFTANTLEVGFDKGQRTYKVKGGKWQKFGVRVWPEVLLGEFGWNPDELQLGDYEFAYTVRVQMDGEKPRKVMGLAQ